MNKFLFTSIMCLITLFTSSQNLKSPNNNLDLNFSIDENGRATYNLIYHDNPVILNSGLGFILKDNVEWMKVDTLDMVNDFKVVNVSFDSMDEIWSPVWGEESKIRNNYNEMFVELEQEGSKRKVNIRFRLFDDSLGFRYEFPLQENLGSFIVIDEKTEFAMAGDHTAIWIPGDYDTQEYNYITSKLSEIKQKSIDF
ncbi:MAG: glycoside hydrolase family 97 N-terminal domain-containing protein, partial [Flavobacteriaceae bacterium]|nr:glycoside hydrolase family 97 N-terminal domain-containing protein [Flavobacteriaceae bacterium]